MRLPGQAAIIYYRAVAAIIIMVIAVFLFVGVATSERTSQPPCLGHDVLTRGNNIWRERDWVSQKRVKSQSKHWVKAKATTINRPVLPS
jgi:hypothetical protein